MTAVTLPLEPGTDLTLDEPPILEMSGILDESQLRKKHKKKSKDSLKRSRSCSTDASCCSSASKCKKKKKKHHRKSLDERPGPKVNPIFLWVKEDNAKIIEVRCEDYDRRNRLKLTKTAGGWRATPHVGIQKWLSEPKFEPKSPKIEPSLMGKTELAAPKLESELGVRCENEYMSDNEIPPPKLEMCRVDDRQVCRNDDDMPMPPLERQIEFVDHMSVVTISDSEDDMADDEREMAKREEEMAKIAQGAAEHEQESADREREVAEREQAEREMAEKQQAEREMSGTEQIMSSENVPQIAEGTSATAGLISESSAHPKTAKLVSETTTYVPKEAELVPTTENVPENAVQESGSAEHVPELAESQLEQVATDENVCGPEMPNTSSVDKNETSEILAEVLENSAGSVIPSETLPEDETNASVEAAKPVETRLEAEVANAADIPAEIIPKPTGTECRPNNQQETTSFATAESSQAQENSAESIEHPKSFKMVEAAEKPECSIKCCDESNNVDENHNNEFDSDPRSSCLIEPSTFVQDLEEILGAIENPQHRAETAETAPQKDVDEYDHSALMSELEEMMNERMKHESHKEMLDDIYTFVPSPSHNVEVVKPKAKDRPTSKIERVIEAVKAKSSLIAKANEEKPKEPPKLKNCDLESLDLLWRLPEGTTIHHSKPFDKEDNQMPACTTATISLVPPPVVTTAPSVAQPVQEEPLNLGKPRRPIPSVTQAQLVPPPIPHALKKEIPPCKVEVKPQFPLPMPVNHSDVKSTSKFTPEMAKTMEPLAQLKEIMSDPEVAVPDPLLVPKERLSALIANPKKEIPRLMALANGVKYPKPDTNLMEVSLAHLQLLLQGSKKEDELKLIQKHADILQSHLKNDASSLDPATMSALNQMLWFPYLSHLDRGRSSNPQDIMGMMNMMYPYNAWGQQSYDYAQQYAQQNHLMNFWQEMQKPGLGQNSHAAKGFGDLYKTMPAMAPSLYTSAPSLDPRRVATSAASYQPRQHKHSRRHHNRAMLPSARRDFVKPPMTPDFRKSPMTPDFPKTSVTPDFLKSSVSPDFLKSSVSPDFLKKPVTPDFLKSSVTPDFLKSSATPDFLKPTFDMLAWTLPQTSESGRTPQRHASRQPISQPRPPPPLLTTTSTVSEPKLKVRKFDVDPNAVPKLINKNLTAPTLPPLVAMPGQVPSPYHDTNHLWNPLYGAVEHRQPDYSSSGHWNWTTPVTVSGK